MKSLIALSILFVLCLSSCGILRDESTHKLTLPVNTGESVQNESADATAVTEAPFSESESESKAETEAPQPLPALIGLYDDLQENGVYTRLDSWNAVWTAGVDIAVFDVILSGDASLNGHSYKELWQAEAEQVTLYPASKPYLTLEYTLNDGTAKVCEIRTPADAESVIADGYLEVYLYDDIHQPDGAWYSHLTAADVTDETVISSVKLTAGEHIDSVTAITLTACLDGSEAASVEVTDK